MGKLRMYRSSTVSACDPFSVSTRRASPVTSTWLATCDTFNWKSTMTVCPTVTFTPFRISWSYVPAPRNSDSEGHYNIAVTNVKWELAQEGLHDLAVGKVDGIALWTGPRAPHEMRPQRDSSR